MNTDCIVLAPEHPDYPRAAEEVLRGSELCAVGNLSLLGRRGVGICGSRDASPDAQEYALEFGNEAAKQGLVIVTGYARGVDRLAHKGALQSGGATIAVLPEGMNSFRLVRELGPLIDLNENFLALSMFGPDAVWKPWRAMERNKLIVALSVAVFVVEARETGGTINCAMECVRQKKTLWAIAYSEPFAGREGNVKLLQDSAIPLSRRGDLRKALEAAASGTTEEIRQLAFNLG